jgi:PAS domain S-box-containing protein
MLDPAIFDALPDALVVAEDDVIVWASSAAGRMLGTTAGELVGRPLRALLAPGERDRLQTLQHQRATGWAVPETCRARFVRDDGREVPVDLRFGAAGAGEPAVLVLAARDATEIDRAETLMGRLAELSARLGVMIDADSLLDASEPLFAALGWRGGFTEILDGGSITRRAIGAPPGDPVGDYARSLVGRFMPLDKTPILAEVKRTDRALFLDNVPGLLSGPRREAAALSESMEKARLTRSVWCPVRVAGQTTHLLSLTGKDLTEHDFVAIQLFAAQVGTAIQTAQLRAELVRRERLAAVGEMAAVLAHEVRNPLGVIFNALGTLRKQPPGLADAGALLDIVSEEATRLRKLVSDLLDFARPPAPSFEPAVLGPILQQAIEAARHDPSCADVEAATVVRVPDDPPMVETDPALLRRALVNLIVNSLQHVAHGGGVTVSAARTGARGVEIRVHNDGQPIPPDVARRIFEPFFTTKATGTGLGLAIVRRIVEDLRGRVDLAPTDAGVSFSIVLPVAPPTT